MIAEDNRKRRASIIEHAFLQYGAGARFFKPVTTSRLWNRFCWLLIIMGICGWLLAFWLLRNFTE